MNIDTKGYENYTYEKSTCERYTIRFPSTYSGWAVIMIDEDGGFFSAQSDFGDYNYRWLNHGQKSFKHFIVNCLSRDPHYLLKKIATKTYHDMDKTLDNWKQRLIDIRREDPDETSKEDVRSLWNYIVHDIDWDAHPETILNDLYDHEDLSKISNDAWEDFYIAKDYPCQAWSFVKIVMPAFYEILSKEIE